VASSLLTQGGTVAERARRAACPSSLPARFRTAGAAAAVTGWPARISPCTVPADGAVPRRPAPGKPPTGTSPEVLLARPEDGPCRPAGDMTAPCCIRPGPDRAAGTRRDDPWHPVRLIHEALAP